MHGSRKKRTFAGIVSAGLFLFAGCSTTTARNLTYDHTVGITKSPVKQTVHFSWRVRTFWHEEMVSFYRRYVSFPLLVLHPVPDLHSPCHRSPESDVLATWLDRKSGGTVAGSVELLLEGDQFFSRFEESISCATNRIDLKTYIFDNDDVALRIAERLRNRSGELDIRILYDAVGSRIAWKTDADSLPAGYTGVDDIIDHLEQEGLIETRRGSHTLLSSDHSKYFLFDDRIAYFGGMNIGREYRYDWRDAMFALRGPVVDRLSLHFEDAWNRSSFRLPRLHKRNTEASASSGEGNLYLIGTTPTSHSLYKGTLRAIKKAEKRIYIENPYLWNQPVLYQLCAARKRGVDVRVTLPRDINHGIGVAANRKVVRRLLKHGVRVFVYPGMTHVKAAVYDDWASFGSANFDDLSLHKNYELNLFTDDSDIVRQVCEELLEAGQMRSVEIFHGERAQWLDHFRARITQYL